MLPYDDLPIILVSAANESAAVKIISDIINNEVREEQHDENSSSDRVWRIANKYYMADVRLQPFTDDDPTPPQSDNIEAHIVYLTEEECAGSGRGAADTCSRRVQRAGGAGRRAHVRLLAAECAVSPDSLTVLAVTLRLELVPMCPDPDPDLDPDTGHANQEEERGVGRVRDALHAHTWRGLQRTALAPAIGSPPAYRECSGSESSSGGEEDVEGDEEEVERAEAFVEALGAVRGAAEQCAALEGAERARRAEVLLAAFCRALGHRLDTY